MPPDHILCVYDSYVHSQICFNIMIMVLAVLNKIDVKMMSPGLSHRNDSEKPPGFSGVAVHFPEK